MKWLETIRVRTAGGGQRKVLNDLSRLIQEARNQKNDEGLVDLTYCVHGSIPGHVYIHVVWDTASPHVLGSRTGLSPAQTLESFGLVDHSVWIDKT